MTQVLTQQEQPQTFKRRDLHQQVTDTIVQQLETGVVPWQQSWKGGNTRLFDIPANFSTGKKYRGINIVLLWCSMFDKQYSSNEWGSFKQWQAKKESVRKGEKGSLIVYYDTLEKEVDGKIEKIPFLKSSVVFNRCQLSSYTPDEQQPENINQISLVDRLDRVEEFVFNTKADIEHKGTTPCYIPSQDKILMPYGHTFKDTETATATEGYYSTLLHELTHWTGSKARMKREGGKKFGDQNYAAEELVAELGAAFLCAEFKINNVEKGDQASYIASWLKVLKDNKKYIITAASEASKAVEYLQTLQPN
ncbi:ArdC family protein [Niabella hibiscisoli]|uniref:ArdC family protein n=1 Tax=Niabella hibiscisoli TaxID=1825928 RepID=UPI001F0E1C9F|nr:zincin-like metallopeptidase domain-containing protein [Niabella hibiscisoli]MCH5716698.1 zincin-like metallopeptidase domain-containing protein [Niabella hibiscisoli]